MLSTHASRKWPCFIREQRYPPSPCGTFLESSARIQALHRSVDATRLNSELGLQRIGYARLIVLAHLRINRQENRMVLGELRLSQVVQPLNIRVRRLTV